MQWVTADKTISRQDEDKLYLCVSSPTIKDKPVRKKNVNAELTDQKYETKADRQVVYSRCK